MEFVWLVDALEYNKPKQDQWRMENDGKRYSLKQNDQYSLIYSYSANPFQIPHFKTEMSCSYPIRISFLLFLVHPFIPNDCHNQFCITLSKFVFFLRRLKSKEKEEEEEGDTDLFGGASRQKKSCVCFFDVPFFIERNDDKHFWSKKQKAQNRE